MKKIIIYCGESIQNMVEIAYHPVNDIKLVAKSIDRLKYTNAQILEHYSNSADFISAIKYVCEANNVELNSF